MILIRADANSQIGVGHIMRCLSIADAARDVGQDVVFILADNNAKELVCSRGYNSIILDSEYYAMEDELELWPQIESECIIVDSYYVTHSYLRKLKSRIRDGKLVYIDDLAQFAYPVDVLINYNVFGLDIDYHGLFASYDTQEPKLMLGPCYAPLRAMFKEVDKKIQPDTINNILVSTGGSDTLHLALSILKADPKRFKYNLLIGALNPDRAEIEALAHLQPNIILHENVMDMKNLIAKMDIAVSAAGSTLYEICACGIPLITFGLADNQIHGAETFEKLGLAENLGDIRKHNDPVASIIQAIEKLSLDYSRRVDVGKRMQQMIDGYGADRIVQEILINDKS